MAGGGSRYVDRPPTRFCVRIVAVSRLRPGMRLGRPVYSCSAGVRLPLLQPDALVTERVRAGLERAGVFAVYVNDAISEGITPVEPISAELRDRAMRTLDETFQAVATQGVVTRIPGEQIERLGAWCRRSCASCAPGARPSRR